ncbi:MAG: hypothetical protein A2151_09420 [Candidatus Muproteobacteria bacterium RBG_16_65_34]|uniref:Outer membrane protein assembly factor BamE n=1 Tax=Candidatus Muproteobacteria bacterium RBG_16_65_34 TaxID=1817760 RepID=A0A1F6TPU6_9PROT|nr:MAG: hypothetical protein A2151_09420 [Candidatus Muproteobacteria bacterium RBG_16_65_34]
MRSFPFAALLAAAALLAGCVSAYKIDVQQGNVVSQEMLEKLKPGMTKSQVRFALGTPLIADSFHPDRWDYFYSLKKGGDPAPQTHRLTVVFRNDALARIDGNAPGPTSPATGFAGPGPAAAQTAPQESPDASAPLRPPSRAL